MGRYQPGGLDGFLSRDRRDRRKEREKNEANRPTATEIGQVTIKLAKLTKQLALQQEQIRRATPTVTVVSGSSPGGQLGEDWMSLISLSAARDTSYQKGRALVLVSVSAVKDGDGIPLLECLVGGSRITSFPGSTGIGDSFGGTGATMITGNQRVELRGKSTVESPSPVGDVHMSVTVVSIA